ncbi:protein tudor-like [Cherax quadricarinatus]
MDGPNGGRGDCVGGGEWRSGNYDATNQIKRLLNIHIDDVGKQIVDAQPHTPPQNIPGHRQGGNMKSLGKYMNVAREEYVIRGRDPPADNCSAQGKSAVTSDGQPANFPSRSNMAKDGKREISGVYVCNVPCLMTWETLKKIFSEHGKVVGGFIRKPKNNFLPSQVTWAIVNVESRSDAEAMIAALDHTPPLYLKVELAMTDEEKQKRHRDKTIRPKLEQECVGKTCSVCAAKLWEQPYPCVSCGTLGKFRCSVCKALYCSEKCQMNDWYYHKNTCSPPPLLEAGPSSSPNISRDDNRDHRLQVQSSSSSISNQTHASLVARETTDLLSLMQQLRKMIHNENREEKQQIETGESLEDKHRSDQYCLSTNVNFERDMESDSLQKRAIGCPNIQQTLKTLQNILLSQGSNVPVSETERRLKPTSTEKEQKPTSTEREQAPTSTGKQQKPTSTEREQELTSTGKQQKPTSTEREQEPTSTGKQQKLTSTEREPRPTSTTIKFPRTCNRIQPSRPLRRPYCESASSVKQITSNTDKESTETLAVSQKINTGIIEKGIAACVTSNSCSNSNESNRLQSGCSTQKLEEFNNFFSSASAHISSPVVEGSVSPELRESLLNMHCVLDELKLSQIYEGFITRVESYKYFTLVVNDTRARAFYPEAQELLVSAPFDEKFKPRVGCQVAATSLSDNSWNRAFIYKIEGENYHVIFIDLGNMETVKMVKPLPIGPLSELPGFAILAKIHCEVEPEIKMQLQKMITLEEKIVLKVISKKSKSLKVSLLSSDSFIVVADYILRPWYTSIPLLHDVKGTPSCPTSGRLSSLGSKLDPSESLFSQDKSILTDVDICKRNFEEKPEDFSHRQKASRYQRIDEATESSKVDRRKNSHRYSEVTRTPVASSLQSMVDADTRERFWAVDLRETVLENKREYIVVPVWVDEHNKLCVHLVSKKSTLEYQKLKQSLVQHCARGCRVRDVQAGEMVCGFVVSDGTWYRAQVKKVDANFVHLYMVDFGNFEIVPQANICEFTASLMQLPCFCIKVKVHGISEEDEMARSKMLSLVDSSALLLMCPQGADSSEFELYDPRTNILLNDQLSSSKTMVDHKELPSAETSFLVNKLTEEDHSNPSDKSISFLSKKNSGRIEELPRVSESSAQLEIAPIPSLLQIPGICKTDGVYSADAHLPPRETHTGHTMRNTSICNTSSVACDKSVTSTLPASEEVNTDRTYSESMVVASKVPMYATCKSTQLPVAKDVSVFVFEACNPHGIFVIPRDSLHLIGKLEEMMDHMKKYCENASGGFYRPILGELCLAKFSEDQRWYRAACIRPELESALVIFIDYGNTEEVPYNSIRQIQESFLELPCLALHCILHGISEHGIQKAAAARIGQLLPKYSEVIVDVLEQHSNGTYIIAVPEVTQALITEGLVVPSV